MKKFLQLLESVGIGIGLMVVLIAYAGEPVDLPYDVVISEPLTDKAEKMYIKIHYMANGKHYAVLEYKVLNNDRTEILAEHSFAVRDIPDDPETITANCTAEGEPWAACTGAGTCTDDCDESTTDMTDYVGSFWSTFDSRTVTLMNQDLQSRHATQAKP